MSFKKHGKTHPVSRPTRSGMVFILNDKAQGAAEIILESIRRIKKEYLPHTSFWIVSPEPINSDVLKAEEYNFSVLRYDECSRIFSGNIPELFFFWNNASDISATININELLRNVPSGLKEDEYHVLEWDNQPPDIFPGILISPEPLGYILQQAKGEIKSFTTGIDYYLRILRLKKNLTIRISSDCPFSPGRKFIFRPGIAQACRRWYHWNVLEPLKTKNKAPSFINEPPLTRLVFVATAVIVLILLPLISFNAGISGDEEKHHMHAEKVYNFFITKGEDTTALYDPQLKLNYYGQSFDLMTFLVIKLFNAEKIYEIRHVMNGAVGALAIITAGFLARFLAGNLAGILTMVFLFLSPRFLGHSMNNPMDIPFALGYVFTIFQIIRFLDRLPVFSYHIASLIVLGIAFTISIRIGGLLLIPYLFMFSGLYLLIRRWPWKFFSTRWLQFAGKGLKFLLVISVIAYFLSLIPWPYGLVNPLKHPFEALRMMSNIDVSLRVFFDGDIHWSDRLPWYYIPKNILISVPVIILAGFALSILLISYWKNTTKPYWFFVLLFSTVFPVAYVIYIESNVYGGWRHLIFIYPTMVVLAALACKMIYDVFSHRYFKLALGVIILASLIMPGTHIIRNYPIQYIYFNQLAGGVNKAYKNFETDYYLVSLKSSTDWLKENILDNKDLSPDNPVRVISNAPTLIIQYYFRDYLDVVHTPYTRYYDRGVYDWDYAVFFCNYIDPYQIRNGIWPPKNTIFSVKVDDVVVGAVVKRENRYDFEGTALLNKGASERDIAIVKEGIAKLERAAEYDKGNESAWINLATGYIFVQEFEKARQRLNSLLEIYPQYDRALSTIGYSYIIEADVTRDIAKVDRAIAWLNEAIRVNYKHATSYYNLGLAYYFKKDYQTAIQNLQKAIDFSPGYREPYLLSIAILEETGHHEQAARWREYLQKL